MVWLWFWGLDPTMLRCDSWLYTQESLQVMHSGPYAMPGIESPSAACKAPLSLQPQEIILGTFNYVAFSVLSSAVLSLSQRTIIHQRWKCSLYLAEDLFFLREHGRFIQGTIKFEFSENQNFVRQVVLLGSRTHIWPLGLCHVTPKEVLASLLLLLTNPCRAFQFKHQ